MWEQGRAVHDGDRVTALEGFITDVTLRHEQAEALERTLNGTIQAISRADESRDPYTAGHQQRVAALARLVAAELGLSEDAARGLRVAGLLHDVGKIVVPSEILSKRGSLSVPEMEMVRRHVDVGYEILRGTEFPWPIADIVRLHHERLDGSGYPRGIEGAEIGIEARILAVVDVVEAMSSHRPYRPALGLDAARAEVERGRGVLFDADVVDACGRVIRDRGFSFDDIPDDAGTLGLTS